MRGGRHGRKPVLVVMVKGSVDAGKVVASECRCGNRVERGGRGGESSRYVMVEGLCEWIGGINCIRITEAGRPNNKP